ncbi:MAG: hypothetical protein L6300_07915 [Syntrophaceae bacterium]|nr:hypothetical protein [Pseudomonadota bacterium]MCG2740152.1 hypothetical protein [Syntrophaceae bacterium]
MFGNYLQASSAIPTTHLRITIIHIKNPSVPKSFSAVFPFGLQSRNLLLFKDIEGDFADQRAGEVFPKLDIPGAAPADQVFLTVDDQRLKPISRTEGNSRDYARLFHTPDLFGLISQPRHQFRCVLPQFRRPALNAGRGFRQPDGIVEYLDLSVAGDLQLTEKVVGDRLLVMGHLQRRDNRRPHQLELAQMCQPFGVGFTPEDIRNDID